ncbi:hypothetical protein HMPREF1981_00675 [Bacteroides pyogenes F0041]|uniref:Uncharacterized protein n=1 Tax=Bacteroides pyogenes F0041 TaxID=1321819 RepID=U2E750_9BACE|nr:hypothetical protein HMPREF1981_00675 [Bacteroides pyogenes F0041]
MTMSDFSFFTTLQAGWLNAWIPSFGMVLIQFIYMAIFREGGKRAVDTSWYTAKDKANASVSTILQIAILVLPFSSRSSSVRHGFLREWRFTCFRWRSLSGLFTAMWQLLPERPSKEESIVGRAIRCTFSFLRECSAFVSLPPRCGYYSS